MAESYFSYVHRRTTEQGYRSYRSKTWLLFTWLSGKNMLPENVGIQEALQFKAFVCEKALPSGEVLSNGTVHNYLSYARSFFDYLVLTDGIKTNPLREITLPRIADHISRNQLTPSQMNRLLEYLVNFDEHKTKHERFMYYRVHVLAEFLYSTGLRISEACNVKEEDINFNESHVYIRKGKGDISRIAFLTSYATDILSLYCNYGRKLLEKHIPGWNQSLLFGASNYRIDIFINEKLRKVCSLLNIPEITSHGFRHSLGTHLLKAGCDMRYIQVILGHERLGTTQVYTKVDKEDLKSSIDRFHPRSHKHVSVV
jgi:integrase/recombinase XerD